MNVEYEWDGSPQRADGWPHILKPYVRCGQAMQDDIDAKEQRQQRAGIDIGS